jgi:hypothetical protein
MTDIPYREVSALADIQCAAIGQKTKGASRMPRSSREAFLWR